MTTPRPACGHADYEWDGALRRCISPGCKPPAELATGSTSPVGGSYTVNLPPSAITTPVADKPDWTLFPWVGGERALEAVAYGARKYEPNDWRGAYTRDQLMGKIMRHLAADMRGEAVDVESGLLHVKLAAADLLFLLEEWS